MTEKLLTNGTLALVAAGGNLPSSAGSPGKTLRAAIAMIAEANDVSVISVSQFWQTPAYPAGSGPDFVNAALTLVSRLDAQNLLRLLHRIEAELGRSRDAGRWAARGIDLDLIAFGDAVLPDPDTQAQWRGLAPERQAREAPEQLILPHPRMQDRGFVLVPLAQVAPQWVHPVLDRSVAQLLADLPASARQDIRPVTT